MKSILVTLLSGFMVYMGYIYHPIMHRAGNNIYKKFQTETVPAENKLDINTKENNFNNSPITSHAREAKLNDLSQDNNEVGGSGGFKKDEIQMDGNVIAPKTNKNADKKANPGRSQSKRNSNRKSGKLPQSRFDLHTSIKKGLDVSNPAGYFISDIDRELGEKIIELEAEFDRQYENRGLTLQEIKQLKADFNESFSRLARQYGLSSQQLAQFQGIIRDKL